jgi:hypothetical protein
MIGCRAQQTCRGRAEEAVEAGRNGKDGTSTRLASRAEGRVTAREWTREPHLDGGASLETPGEELEPAIVVQIGRRL